MDRTVQRRYRREFVRVLRRLYTTNRNTYLQQLKVRVKESETSYVKRLKRGTTSMVSVLRNGSSGITAPGHVYKGAGGRLWQYFNSPFNVVFMTTNIFAFAGIVAFSTLIDIRHLHGTAGEQHQHQPALAGAGAGSGADPGSSLAMVNPGTIRRHLYPMVTTIDPQTQAVPLPELPELSPEERNVQEQEEEQDQTLEFLRRKISEKSLQLAEAQAQATAVDTAVETPLHTYTATEVNIPKKSTRVQALNATRNKASLFNMLYSYEIYRSLLQDSSESKTLSWRTKLWRKEVSALREDIGDFMMFVPSLNNFYANWNEEFQATGGPGTASAQPQSVENFGLPSWRTYPDRLRSMCNKLYSNNMETLDDFQQFYENTESRQLKELLQMWYYDNYKRLPPVKGNKSHELFYNELLGDAMSNPHMFKRYASVVLDPENKRSGMLFSSMRVDEGDKEPYVHLDTMVNVLQGYLQLEQNGGDKSAAYLRLVQMLNDNVYMPTREKGVFVQLGSSGSVKSSRHWWLSRSKSHTQLDEALGSDPRLMSLLKELH